jgi:SAM-dependent methyltransferase
VDGIDVGSEQVRGISVASLKRRLEAARARWNALQTAHYLLVQLAYRMGLQRHQSGAVHSGWDVDRTRAYVHEVFEDYLHYGQVARSDLAGARILEIGPGANLGVALLFAAHGAREVVCVDRFESDRNDELNRALYAGIVASLTGEARERAVSCLDNAGMVGTGTITCHFGQPVEQIDAAFDAGSFDLIVSRAVLEHVYSPEQAWRSMDHVLRPGGRMLHKVDFRCHSFYEHKHPLHFLTVPQWLWGLVSAPDPTLNRARLSRYTALLAKYRYCDSTYVTHVTGQETELKPHVKRTPPGYQATADQARMIERIRPNLAAPFASSSLEDLVVNGAFVIATKADVR